MKGILMVTVLVVMMAMSGMAAADVKTGWAMDTPNEYNGTHTMIDFDDGTCGGTIESTTNEITFENDDLYPWEYACKNCGLTIHPYGGYIVNGNCGAWCGIPGGYGNISFEHDVCHVSVLASTWSGLQMDAYNESGVMVTSSGWAGRNWNTSNFTRVSVDRPADCDISYVCIHDTGNLWLVDDLIVGYEPVCTEVVINTTNQTSGIAIGDRVNFTISCADQHGEYFMCPQPEWSIIGNTGVVTWITNSSDRLVIEALGEGSVDITATTCDGITSNAITVTVRDNPYCNEIVINTNGSDTTVCFGMTIDFAAECYDQYDGEYECPGLNWTSSDTRVGTMDGSVFTVDKKGNTTIMAACDTCVNATSNPVNITVVPGQKMLAHCQKFIHGQGDDHWNESAYTNKTHPCNQTLYNQTV